MDEAAITASVGLEMQLHNGYSCTHGVLSARPSSSLALVTPCKFISAYSLRATTLDW